MGTRNNQNWVQIPTGKLKERLRQLCEAVGIQFFDHEESYTSKASFLDADLVPTYGEKPEGWKASGKRVKRGLYKTAKGWLINADCNGAANLLAKVQKQLGLCLAKINRAALTLPKRYRLDSLSKSYRKRCEVLLQQA